MRELNRKILVIAVALMGVAMLTTPLVASVNAKPKIATVVFRSEIWGNRDNPNEKYRMGPAGDSGNVLMKQINIIGIPPLTDKTPPDMPSVADALAYRGGIRLVITKDSNTYTLLGTVEQLLITGVAHAVQSALNDNEKATITITENPSGVAPDGWEESTLELSIIWVHGEGKILGNRGTGIFENAQFRGTYSMAGGIVFIPPGIPCVYKAQWGTGEIMFP